MKSGHYDTFPPTHMHEETYGKIMTSEEPESSQFVGKVKCSTLKLYKNKMLIHDVTRLLTIWEDQPSPKS